MDTRYLIAYGLMALMILAAIWGVEHMRRAKRERLRYRNRWK